MDLLSRLDPLEDDLASPTLDPAPSPPSPCCTERMPELTADGEPEPTMTDEPSPHGATEPQIATEPELLMTFVSQQHVRCGQQREGRGHLRVRTPPRPDSSLAPPGSLVPPAPPWAVVAVHPAPWDSTSPALPLPSGSVRLLHPSDSILVLCHSGSTMASQIHVSVSVTGAICSILALRIFLVTLAHRLSVSASGSLVTFSATIGQTPGVVSPSSPMAPPSIGSFVGRHHGCGLAHLVPPAPSPSCLRLVHPGLSCHLCFVRSTCCYVCHIKPFLWIFPCVPSLKDY
ncbi:Spectrin beta chain, non-erythrocytic 5 [Labeo rohita]|uniref:Spectrin beta chain, non-erythrocytic 5 n=1 Tax=Labeo rohita TaxID=84645 RepID=A0ABQ8M3A0_LABRO|nr:Spectrin beta chain, non-erythrocytic 5 [Labeo rohita]